MQFAIRRFTEFPRDIPKLLGTLLDIEQVLSKNIDQYNIRDGAIINALLGVGAVTPAKISGGVARVYSAQYTGTGAADRLLAIGFQARMVKIVRQSNGDVFEAFGSGSTAWTYFKRDSTGAVTAAASDFQGIVGTDVKLGSGGTGGASNANTETYWLQAIG